MDEVKDKLIEILPKLIEFIERSADFTTEQAPILIQEILTYSQLKYAMHAGFAALAILVGLGVVTHCQFRVYKSKSKEGLGYDIDSCHAISILVAIATLVAFCPLISKLTMLFKVTFAPRMYLLEYLRDLTN